MKIKSKKMQENPLTIEEITNIYVKHGWLKLWEHMDHEFSEAKITTKFDKLDLLISINLEGKSYIGIPAEEAFVVQRGLTLRIPIVELFTVGSGSEVPVMTVNETWLREHKE